MRTILAAMIIGAVFGAITYAIRVYTGTDVIAMPGEDLAFNLASNSGIAFACGWVVSRVLNRNKDY